MKVIKIIFSILLVFIVLAAAGIAIFLKTFDIDRYKPQIIEQASNALGRDVDFEDIDLEISLRDGLRINIRQLQISEDPRFGTGEFLTLENVYAGVDLISFLIKREITVSDVKIKSPKVIIIREKDGSINVQNLGKSQSASAEPLQSEDDESRNSPKDPPSLPLVAIKKIKLDDGIVTYVDRTFDPEVILDASQLKCTIDQLSLVDPFDVRIEGSVFSNEKNIDIKGKMQIDMKDNSLDLSDLEMTTDLDDLSMEKMRKSLSMLKGVQLPSKLKGKLSVDISKMKAGAAGLVSLSATARLNNGSATVVQLSVPAESIYAELYATEKDIDIKDFSLRLGSGRITAEGAIRNYLKTQRFSINTNVSDISIAEIIDQSGKPVTLEGLLFGKVNINGEGFNADKALSSLAGDGKFEIKEGKLKDINILRTVLGKLSMFPNLVDQIKESLPDRYKETLKRKDTILTKAELKTVIQDSRALITPVTVEADGFIFKGKGWVDFNQNYSLNGYFYIPEDLAASMIKAVDALQYLLDEKNQILIPLKISGKGPDVKVFPDLEYIGKKALETEGKKKLRNLLDKALGKEKDQEGSQEQKTQPQGEQPKDKNILDNIFDSIFN